jgi:hypothetical protein
MAIIYLAMLVAGYHFLGQTTMLVLTAVYFIHRYVDNHNKLREEIADLKANSIQRNDADDYEEKYFKP